MEQYDDPTDPQWGVPALPDWVSGFRPYQVEAVEEILDAYDRGKKVVMLDAPTGSGKTLIAELVRRQLAAPTVYTCSTKGLQDQFLEDFHYADVLKGRSNYPTELYPSQFNQPPFLSAEDCEGQGCGLCEMRCPYKIAKRRAQMSPLAVVNTAYLLAEASGSNSIFRGRELIVADEADLLEGALMGHVEVRISQQMQRRYNINPPQKKTVAASWVEWVAETKPKLQKAIAQLGDSTEDRREERKIGRVLGNLALLEQGLDSEDTSWVYTDYDRGNIVFRPVKVDSLAQQHLWSIGEKWLLMSASLVSGQQMADDLGLEPDEWEVVTCESRFPAENRPIYLAPIDSVTSKNYEEAVPKVCGAIERILDNHPGERVLVHTVSYKLAGDVVEAVKRNTDRPVIHYTNSQEREGVLEKYRKTEGSVLVAPSMDRGVDLPEDECRVQVIAKVPYPYLGDKQISARLYSRGGQEWFDVQTTRTLIQMSGRGVRSKDDECVTYILDKSFLRLYRQAKSLFPEWWTEALDFSGEAKRKLVA